MSTTGDFPQIECKKHGYRQTGDGGVISFVLHPNDIPSELASAPLGTRYMLVLAQLNDNETVKPPRPPSLTQQAAILCGDPMFLRFLEEKYQHLSTGADPADFDAPSMVREICRVDSRAEFDTDPHAGQRWRSLHAGFEAWKVL